MPREIATDTRQSGCAARGIQNISGLNRQRILNTLKFLGLQDSNSDGLNFHVRPGACLIIANLSIIVFALHRPPALLSGKQARFTDKFPYCTPLTPSRSRILSENSDRSEGEAGGAGFFDHLRRIVVLFNEKDRKIQPARIVRSRSVYSRTASLSAY